MTPHAASPDDAAHRAAPAPLRLTSADGQRRYRVQVHPPTVAAPAAGFPVLYLLDGAAASATLHGQPALAALPVLIVTIAHDHDAQDTKLARAFDYTPPAPDGTPRRDPRVPDWAAGGADAFLDLLDHAVRPAVARDWPVRRGHDVLAGHSYGGLCVLHALCAGRDYAGFVCASPSVWWHDGAILDEVETLARAGRRAPARVHLMVGEREAWHAQPLGSDGTPASRRGGAPTAPAAQALADRLASVSGVDTAFAVIPQGTHASMAATTVAQAVRIAAQRAASTPA